MRTDLGDAASVCEVLMMGAVECERTGCTSASIGDQAHLRTGYPDPVQAKFKPLDSPVGSHNTSMKS